MDVVLFGATGMVGQGALRECLLDPDVSKVLVVGRTATGQAHPKLREIVHKDLFDITPIEPQLRGLDACFFCLGVSSAGMKEADYARVTHDLTLAVAKVLARASPQVAFVYVSGAGTDSTEKGRVTWARVKGRTENALLAMPFRAAFMFRPGYIQPMHGVRSKTGWYRAFYAVGRPLYPLLRRLAPRMACTTEDVGRAMIEAAQRGAPSPIVESADIVALARRRAQQR